jgi:hypothetical protein
MDRDDTFWRMYAIGFVPVAIWLDVVLWLFGPLVVALTVTVAALTSAGMAGRVVLFRRHNRALRRQTDAHFEQARWALLTQLTEGDERWLAERHFWVVPTQVARLRAGLDPQPEWRCYFDPPPELRRLQEMQSRSQAARAQFEGVRRTEIFIESAPVEGELLPVQR